MNTKHSNDEFDELLSAYVDDELTAAQRAQVERRLQSDPRAARLVEDLRSASSAVRGLPRETAPRDLQSAIFAKLAADVPHEPASGDSADVIELSQREATARRRSRIWAALTLAALLLLMFFTRDPQPADEPTLARRDAADVANDRGEPDEQAQQDQSRRRMRPLAETPAFKAPAPAAAGERAAASADESDAAIADAYASTAKTKDKAAPAATSQELDAAAAGVEQRGGEVERMLADDSDSAGPISGAYSAPGVDGRTQSSSAPAASTEGAEGYGAARPEASASQINPPVVKIALDGRNARIRFERLLAEHDVDLSADAAPATSESGAANYYATIAQADAADAILVEATPEQIERIRRDWDAHRGPAARERGAVRIGGANQPKLAAAGDGKADLSSTIQSDELRRKAASPPSAPAAATTRTSGEPGAPPRGRAWRLAPRRPSGPAGALGLEQQELKRESSAVASGGRSESRVRVLFLLAPAADATGAPAAAQPAER